MNDNIKFSMEILKALEEIDARLTNLEGGWTKVEIQKARIMQWPQVGDTIYRLNSRGKIIEQPWTDSIKQNDVRMFMGVYKTREEAGAMRANIMNLRVH